MLMDSITIPVCMLFAFICFKARFRWTHFVGVILCLVGLGYFVYVDFNKYNQNPDVDPTALPGNDTMVMIVNNVLNVLQENATEVPTAAPEGVDMSIFGDIMAMCGAILYACSNLMQEYLVKSYDIYEFLGMMGVFGTIIAAIQVGFTEWNTLLTTTWTGPAIGWFIGYALLLFLMYLCTAYFMSIADATSFNLNLLTSDVYAAFAAFILFGNVPGYVYYISLCLTIIGLIFYYIYDYKSIFKDKTTSEKQKSPHMNKDIKSTTV